MDDINISELFEDIEENIKYMTFEELETVCMAVTLDVQLLKEMYYENPSNRRGLC